MKLKQNYTLTGLGNEFVAVPLGNDAVFHGIIKLNESGAEVFRGFSEGLDDVQVAKRLMEKYGLDNEKARIAVATIVEKLSVAGLLDE